MNKTHAVLFAFATALSLSAQNILKNPDFEEIKPANLSEKLKKYLDAEEIPAGWSLNPPGYPSKFTMMTDAETSQSGSCYLRVEQKDPAKHSSASQWWVPVKTGGKYRFTIYAKGKGNLMQQVIAFRKKNVSAGSFISSKKLVPVPSETEWTKFEYEFDMPEGVENVCVHLKMDGVVDLDNAYLGPAETK